MSIKEQYLHSLKASLLNYFDNADAAEILADYSDFFDAGLQDGKTEQAIIDEFGEPNQVAERLKSERFSKNTFTLPILTNVKSKKGYIITIRVILIILLFLTTGFFYYNTVYQHNASGVAINSTIIVICLFLLFINISYKKYIPKFNTERITKALTVCSYILPIMGIMFSMSIFIYTFMITIAQSINDITISNFILFADILHGYSKYTLLIITIISLLTVIFKKQFSLMKTGFQYALLSYVYYILSFLGNFDMDSPFSLEVMYSYSMREVSYQFFITMIIFFTIYAVIRLINHSQSVAEFITPLFVMLFSIISILLFNNTSFADSISSYIYLSIMLSIGILLSFYTKRNVNYCFNSNISSRICLIGMIFLSAVCFVFMILSYNLFFSMPHYDIVPSNFTFEFISQAVIHILVPIVFGAYTIFSIIFISNGKSKKSHRFLCLIGYAPLLIMIKFINIHSFFTTWSDFWNEKYVSDMRELKIFSIIVSIIAIIMPLIVFAVCRYCVSRPVYDQKRGDD